MAEKYNLCLICGRKQGENHRCVFKCPICNSTKTTKSNGILKCNKCGFVNNPNHNKNDKNKNI